LNDSAAVLHRYGNRHMLPLVTLGLVAGFFGGLLGIGGGVVIVPWLVLLLRFSQHLAQGTSLTALLLMSLAGTISYLVLGHGNMVLGLEMGAGGVLGALLGTRLAHRVNGRVLRFAFSAVLVYVGVRMVHHGMITHGVAEKLTAMPSSLFTWAPALAGIGFTAGTLGSILGIAGGFITTPALVILLEVGQKSAQGISFSAMPFTLMVGVLAYRKEQSIDLRSAVRIGVAGVMGVYLGSVVACSLPGSLLRTIFGVGLILVSIPLAMKKRPSSDPKPVR
jgi:uncharacterized membrane protein YfcA